MSDATTSSRPQASYELNHELDGSSFTVRENLVDILERELLGPIHGPEEVLPFSPRSLTPPADAELGGRTDKMAREIRRRSGPPTSTAELHRSWLELVDIEGPFLAIPPSKRVWPDGIPDFRLDAS